MAKSATLVGSLESLNGKVDSATNLLGYVVWHVLPDLRITEAQLAGVAARVGLKDPPTLGNPADAFRRATSPSSQRGESRATRYLVRPVCDTGDKLVRHIVVERVDKAGVKLDHVELAELVYERATKSMTTAWIDQSRCESLTEANTVAKMMTDAELTFVDYTQNLTGPELTRFVMRQLDDMARVTVHPRGAVYFIPRDRIAPLDTLRRFVDHLKSYVRPGQNETPVFQIVPIIDVPDQRKMVGEGLARGVQQEVAQLTADLAELIGRPSKPDGDTITARMGQIVAMRQKVADYEALLETTMSELTAGIDIVDQQATMLLERANDTARDPLIAAIEATGLCAVTWSESKSSAKVTKGLSKFTIKFNRNGWTLKFKSLPGSITARPECVHEGGGEYTVRTSDPDVAMLFVKAKFRIA